MKPNQKNRKLLLNRESLRQMTPRSVPAADLARVVGGHAEDDEGWPTVLRTDCCCMMTSF